MAHILPSQPDGPSLQETTEKIVNELKSRGNFDTFRKACLADVDTRPAYQNLRQRVESTVTTFLGKQKWTPDLNRNQLREKLRKHLAESRFLEIGVDRIVDQVVDRNIYTTYMPQIQLLVKEMLDIKDETEDKIDDDVEMEEATPAPETGGNTFGTWANQFHARVPEPRPDEPTVAASNSSMSISSATNESAAGSASEADSPDIRAQMSPLSDDGKQGWGSFLGKADELDFSGIMNRVGHMDPAIDQMIKSELEADTRETDASAPPAPAQRSGSSNSNMSLEEEEPVDLQSFVGPPESVDSQDGHRRDADREPPLPPRPPRDEPDRGARVDVEPRGGRHPSDEERRRRERERERDRDRDRDRGRRERSRHDEERSRHGDEDRYRRDRDRDRDRDRERDRDRDRWDRDRGDDHEEQRNRGRHHQRRDRDDDDLSGHRGRSGGHSHSGRGHGRDDDRGGGGGGGGGSGQRYYGYGSGRERPAGIQGEVVDGVVEVVVENGQEAEMEDMTVKIESEEVGKVGTSDGREGAVKKDTSRERKDTSKERGKKATSKERDRKMSSSGSKKRESSSTHKKSSRRHDRSSERRSSSKKTGSSEKHAEKGKLLVASVERSSTYTPSSSPTSPSENKSPASTSNDIVAESMPKTKVDSINSPTKEDTKLSNSIKPSSSSEVPSSKKSESSKHKSRGCNSNDKLSKVTAESVERSSKSITNDKASKSSSHSISKSSTSSSTKSEGPSGEVKSDRNAPLSAKDRMAQLMEKYAPYLKDRFRRSTNTSKREPKPKSKPKAPQNTYLGERKRPPSPSSRSSVQCLRQVVAEPDALSVSSVDTADLSDFDDRLEMELELTEPEWETLRRIGWRPVVDDLADIDDDILATATEDLVQVVDLADDVESVDSGFNRSDASSSTSAGSAPLRLALTADEPPLIDLEPSTAAGRRRRQRKVDYIALNSGLDGEDKVDAPTRRRRRPRDDCDWSPSVKASRVGPSPSAELVPRVSLLRLPEMKPRRTFDKEEWQVSSDKENMDGMTRLRDPGAAGDSVRIRPNLAI